MQIKTLYRIRNVAQKPFALLPKALGGRPHKELHQLFDFLIYRQMQKESGSKNFPLWSERRFLQDSDPEKHFDAHYIYHTSWAARILQKATPNRHVDFSSSLYFAGIASAFIPIEFRDYRPVELNLEGFTGRACNLLDLEDEDESLTSVSCMHVIEHIGLGRYGDPLDASGDEKACGELQRVTKIGGRILIVVPVGKSRIEFNAHRVYEFGQVIAMFPHCRLNSCALLKDDSTLGLFRDPPPREFDSQRYGCGCFEFIKSPTNA